MAGHPGDRATVSCKLCAWLCNWLCPDAELERASFWQKTDEWERAQSNDWELWSAETDEQRALNARAAELNKSDAEAAFRLRTEAADAGSTWAMQMVGWHYDTGTLVPADFDKAQEYYHRAVCAGSWTATIRHARLLAEHGHDDHWRAILQDGVEQDFVPAFYWLAWLRYKQSKSRKTREEIKPLLEYAAEKGHPAAEVLLGRMLLSGKFGLREIPRGFEMLRAFVSRSVREQEHDGHAKSRTGDGAFVTSGGEQS
jgi:TPR repeat protein